MRPSLDCSKLNTPRQIAGIDFKIVVGVLAFFGTAALMYKTPGVMVFPILFLIFIRGPTRRDSALLPVYLRHRVQAAQYSPGYITAPNYRDSRPTGFSRFLVT